MNKLNFLIFILLMCFNSIVGQEKTPMVNLFIEQHIEDIKKNPIINWFENDTLFVYNDKSGIKNFASDEIQVVFLSFNEIKNKVKKSGKFKLIDCSSLYVESSCIEAEIFQIIAVDEKGVDFAEDPHNKGFEYRICYNQKTKSYEKNKY